MKYIRKIIIKWSLNQIIKMFSEDKTFPIKEYNIQEIVDFTDGEIMIKIINPKKLKQIKNNIRIGNIPVMKLWKK